MCIVYAMCDVMIYYEFFQTSLFQSSKTILKTIDFLFITVAFRLKGERVVF